MLLTRRPATRFDVEFAKRTHHLAYRDVVERQFGAWDVAEQDGYFAASWAESDHEILEWDGRPCGYVTIGLAPSRVEIHELVVHPDHQNKGIGTTIVRQTLSTARDLDLPVLLQVLHENRAAHLYERLGFEEYAQSSTHRLMRHTSP